MPPIPDLAQTPLEVIATLAVLFFGKQGFTWGKSLFLAPVDERITQLEERVKTLEKKI